MPPDAGTFGAPMRCGRVSVGAVQARRAPSRKVNRHFGFSLAEAEYGIEARWPMPFWCGEIFRVILSWYDYLLLGVEG